jgi:hypothetical protein
MPITVKHSKVSTIPDDTDTDLVRPSDWNADHTLTGLGTMAEQNANAVAITGGTATLTSVTTPVVQATNSAGLALRNSAGTTQISMGGGGGDNVTIAVATNINGANAQIDISPTGTGHVHIKPTGVNSVEIAPTFVGEMDNITIGAITPAAGNFTNLSVTGTTSFDGAQGTAGQALTSAGTGNTPTWSDVVTPTGTQTLTNKTLTNPTITNYTETLYSPAAGSSFTVALTDGTVQKFTTNANTTVTLPSSVAGKSFVIIIAYGGSHSITWAGGSVIKWAGGVTPTATAVNGKFDIFTFFQDGTNTYSSVLGQNY